MITEEFYRVVDYVCRWGIDLRFQNPDDGGFPRHTWEWDEWYPGPWHGVIQWPTRVIWWPAPEAVLESNSWNELLPHALLHELAHCLVDTRPDQVNEVNSPMLGFEYFSSQFLRLTGWDCWMNRSKFVLTESGELWDQCSKQTQDQYVRQSLKQAQKNKLLNNKCVPTYRRPI